MAIKGYMASRFKDDRLFAVEHSRAVEHIEFYQKSHHGSEKFRGIFMKLFKNITDLLSNRESFVMATILSRSGSAPRAVGTRMVVRTDGGIIGTIGGGILEAQVQRLAAAVFKTKETIVREFALTAEDSAKMGMICGGQVQVLIHFVDASKTFHADLYHELAVVSEARKRAWLITRVPSEEDGREPPAQWLVGNDGSVLGVSAYDEVKGFIDQAGKNEPELIVSEKGRFLVEPLCNQGTVYIFGAGHVSQKLAPLTHLVGFRTVVLDDREEFANRQWFDTADELIVLNSFDNATDGLDIDKDSYLVLVTRGHAYDKTVLGQALKTDAGYIGMIGSKRKQDAIYHLLEKEGFSTQDFERVHSPIGLAIGAETPEEIAVSIIAELIQARAERNR